MLTCEGAESAAWGFDLIGGIGVLTVAIDDDDGETGGFPAHGGDGLFEGGWIDAKVFAALQRGLFEVVGAPLRARGTDIVDVEGHLFGAQRLHTGEGEPFHEVV